MLYQYRSTATKPYITVCDDINCWSTKTIKEHFGDWAPVHLDAVYHSGADIYLVKDNLIYTQAWTASVNNAAPFIPCNVTAAGGMPSDSGFYFFRNNEIYDSLMDYNGITCFK